jgi:pimeloyl-ACP methyl ester carboxylesterase
MAIAEVNGQRLYYEVHGEGEPLLCVAGLSADTMVWIPQVQAFAAAHRTVIFDNRDVGQSSMAGGDYEIADMARDALALADELELDSFHLLGVSMGGAIAQEIAIQEPQRVRTFTVAVSFASGGAYARQLARVWGERVMQISREQHVDELMLLNHSEGFYDHPEMVEFIRNAMLANPHPQPPEAFARQLRASSGHDAREGLATLTMPTHVLGGEGDRVADPGLEAHDPAGRAARALGRARRGVQRGRAWLHPGGCCGACGVAISATAASTSSRTGAARPNSTIWSTRETGLPGGATTHSCWRWLPTWRARPNSIETPLESMNSSAVMSTTTPRAELGRASAIRSPVGLATEMSSSPLRRATTTSPRSSMFSPIKSFISRHLCAARAGA